MQTTRKNFVINELKAFNKGVTKKILDEKFCKMSATPFAFYRGTDHLFWADFSKDKRLKEFSSEKTKVWLQGDLHAYNFGSFEDRNGDLVYGLNDFDESVISDYQFDVWRMAISLVLMARENGKSKPADEREYVETFAESYLKQLKNLIGTKKEGKINYTAKSVRGALKEYLKVTDKKNKAARAKMLSKWTVNGKFNLDSPKLGPVNEKERAAIVSAIQGKKNELSQYRRSLRGGLVGERQEYFHVVDVAERLLAGTGSLGTKRFYVLLEGKKEGLSDDIILDVKHQGRASSYPYLSAEDRPYYSFDNDAHRTVEGFRALSVKVDNHLGWIKLPKLSPEVPAGYYSIRERSPEKDAYPGLVADLKDNVELSLTKKANFISMCEQWGEILATSHARSDNDANKARIPYSFEKNVTDIVKGKSKEFAELTYEVASGYADQVLEDYKIFTTWFDTSKCAEILAPRTPSETKAIFSAKGTSADKGDIKPGKSVGKIKDKKDDNKEKDKKKDKKEKDKGKDKKKGKEKKDDKKKGKDDKKKSSKASAITVKASSSAKKKAAAKSSKKKAGASKKAATATKKKASSATKKKASTAAKKTSSAAKKTSSAAKKTSSVAKKTSAAAKKKVGTARKKSSAAKKTSSSPKRKAAAVRPERTQEEIKDILTARPAQRS